MADKKDVVPQVRDKHIHLRCTEGEKEAIERAAKEAGLMTSEYVRLAINWAMKHGIKIAKAG